MTIFNKMAKSESNNQKEQVIKKIQHLLAKVEAADSVDQMRCLTKDTREITSVFFNWKSSTPKNWYSALSKLPK